MQYREDMFQNRDRNVANHFYGNAKREKDYYETIKQIEMLSSGFTTQKRKPFKMTGMSTLPKK